MKREVTTGHTLDDLAHRIGQRALAIIIEEVDDRPKKMAASYARALMKLRGADDEVMVRNALKAIRTYFAWWLNQGGSRETLIELATGGEEPEAVPSSTDRRKRGTRTARGLRDALDDKLTR